VQELELKNINSNTKVLNDFEESDNKMNFTPVDDSPSRKSAEPRDAGHSKVTPLDSVDSNSVIVNQVDGDKSDDS